VPFSDSHVAEQFAKSHPGYDGLLNVIEDALIARQAVQRGPVSGPIRTGRGPAS